MNNNQFHYYIQKNNKKLGPYSLEELKLNFKLTPDCLIWKTGEIDWKKAEDIEELKLDLIPTPPPTSKEKKTKKIKIELYNSFLIWIAFVIILSSISSQVELYQYKSFVKQTTITSFESRFNSETNSFEPVSYDVPNEDIYVREDNGEYYSRWSHYKPQADNEQVTYDETHSFWFRSVKAFFTSVPLDEEERSNWAILMWNFLLSSFISMIPLFIIIFIIRLNRESNSLNKRKFIVYLILFTVISCFSTYLISKIPAYSKRVYIKQKNNYVSKNDINTDLSKDLSNQLQILNYSEIPESFTYDKFDNDGVFSIFKSKENYENNEAIVWINYEESICLIKVNGNFEELRLFTENYFMSRKYRLVLSPISNSEKSKSEVVNGLTIKKLNLNFTNSEELDRNKSIKVYFN